MSFWTGIGSIVGGLLGFAGSQGAASGAIKGAKINARAARWASRKNLQWQRRFAQRGIRWRVKDARKAGVHPLAALGAQTMSFAPSFSGGEPGAGHIAAAGIEANAAQQLGQDFSRAVGAFDDVDTRNDAYIKALQGLQIENAALQNQYLASQIARNTQAGNPPAAPSVSEDRYLMAGQGDSRTGATADVVTVPVTRLASDPDKNYQEAASINDVSWSRTRNGWFAGRSKDYADRNEDYFISDVQHAIRNQVVPALTGNLDRSGPFNLRPGYHWVANPFSGEWSITDNQGRYVSPEQYGRR